MVWEEAWTPLGPEAQAFPSSHRAPGPWFTPPLSPLLHTGGQWTRPCWGLSWSGGPGVCEKLTWACSGTVDGISQATLAPPVAMSINHWVGL